MLSKRRVTFVLLVVVLLSIAPQGTPPAVAFTEGASDNFFGTGAGDDPAYAGSDNSFFGGDAGTSNTTGAHNSFFGKDAGLFNTTGSDNAFVGSDAGTSNTTGADNAFVGKSAGLSNTTGSANAFFGESAGEANTTGAGNAFFGSVAGADNTTGISNSFFGNGAGLFNTAGSENAYFGAAAGFNSRGSFNAFFGRDAGRSNVTGSTGSNNSFFGHEAGLSNITAVSNSFFGRQAGRSTTTGSFNSFFGVSAGANNTTGPNNTFVGTIAGTSNTSENGNTFVGAASNGASGITNATALGHVSQVSQSNSLVLGSINGLNGATSNVKVGMGTASPAEPLHLRRTDGTAKVLVQEASGTLLGRELFELVNNGAARFRVHNTSNNATWDFQSSSGAGSFVIDRVGGDPSLDFELRPTGDLVVRGSVTGTSFISSSDRNLKTDITPAKAAKLMSLLRQLDVSTWRFKSEPEGTINLGPMAQDFHRLFGMGTETTIQIRDLAALALVAAQAQQKEIDDLKRNLARLGRMK